MIDHGDLAALHAGSRRQQDWVRARTFSPDAEKTLRRFSSWEVAELILKLNPSTFRGRLAEDATLPQGVVEPEGRQRWFSLEEINTLRDRLRIGRRRLAPPRAPGTRAVRAAVANFKGGAGKSTVALHFAHAAALEGWRVLAVDFDPQATLSHAMGVVDAAEEDTVWGVLARDLILQTRAMNAAPVGAESGTRAPERALPASVTGLGLEARGPVDFIRPTCWPTIDIVASCANAAFVEFASAQYRHLNPDWTFFAAVSRWLDALPADAYDLIVFDCPPAIGYQSMNAVFAADLLWIPSGPGYWEYDSTTSFLGQLSEALADLEGGFGSVFPAGKRFDDLRFVLTRFEPGNPLHLAMADAFRAAFGARLTDNPIELTRAVEQSGRFLCSIYEIDYRDMTRETWRRARASFDAAYAEFAASVAVARARLALETAAASSGPASKRSAA
jgi:cellulose biosynthesis protein BcsQ